MLYSSSPKLQAQKEHRKENVKKGQGIKKKAQKQRKSKKNQRKEKNITVHICGKEHIRASKGLAASQTSKTTGEKDSTGTRVGLPGGKGEEKLASRELSSCLRHLRQR